MLSKKEDGQMTNLEKVLIWIARILFVTIVISLLFFAPDSKAEDSKVLAVSFCSYKLKYYECILTEIEGEHLVILMDRNKDPKVVMKIIDINGVKALALVWEWGVDI